MAAGVDQWLLAEGQLQAYRRNSSPFVQGLIDVRSSIDDIRILAGPEPHRLGPMLRQLDRYARRLALLEPPTQLGAVHAGFVSAYALALNAVQLRRDAVEAADVELARQASAAASGSLMLLDRARTDLRSALQPPLRVRATTRP